MSFGRSVNLTSYLLWKQSSNNHPPPRALLSGWASSWSKIFFLLSFLWKSLICYCVKMKIILYLLKPVSLYFNYLTRWCSLSETKKETKHKKKKTKQKKTNNTKENSFFQTLLNRPHLSLTLKKKAFTSQIPAKEKATHFVWRRHSAFFFLHIQIYLPSSLSTKLQKGIHILYTYIRQRLNYRNVHAVVGNWSHWSC